MVDGLPVRHDEIGSTVGQPFVGRRADPAEQLADLGVKAAYLLECRRMRRQRGRDSRAEVVGYRLTVEPTGDATHLVAVQLDDGADDLSA